jgi:hypothetical protein
MPILCTCVHLGMGNNVDLESFYFLCVKKLFFILLASKISFFVKHLPKQCCKNGPQQFKKKIKKIQIIRVVSCYVT